MGVGMGVVGMRMGVGVGYRSDGRRGVREAKGVGVGMGVGVEVTVGSPRSHSPYAENISSSMLMVLVALSDADLCDRLVLGEYLALLCAGQLLL